MTFEAPEMVVDVNQVQYSLARLLGQGGQGEVWAVRGQDLAVKFSYVRHPSARERVRENIARIRRLPLKGLNVARPLRALAEPHVGYVMELMTGMVPLKTVMNVPRDLEGDFAPWYLESGSLGRRLRLLARIADLFRNLHAAGFTYGDASPDNVFVSEEHDAAEVWLIDCDNLCHGISRHGLYTGGYGAPELFRGHAGNDSLTDAWSLAAITFEALCATHPFVGGLVHDGGPELEEKAFRGELPWIGDKRDACNIATHGLPMEMVLTPRLRKLAGQCFGDSRLDRQARPPAGAWAESLHKAADQTLICPGCGSSYYFNSVCCPWCDAPRPPFATITFFRRDLSLPNDGRTPFQVICGKPGIPAPVARTTVQFKRWTLLSDRHLAGADSETPRITAFMDGATLVLKGGDAPGAFLVHRRDGNTVRLDNRSEKVDLHRGKSWWWLVPENPERIHRVATFTLHKGEVS